MEHLPDSAEPAPSFHEAMIRAALGYRSLTYRPIPLLPGSKQASVKWKRYQTEVPSEQQIRRWFSAGEPNVALLTGNGLVVIDVDDAGFVSEVLRHCGDTPMRCQTPKGGQHLYYQEAPGIAYGNFVRVNGWPMDLRWRGGYIVAPWSRSAEGISYHWLGDVLPVARLPVLSADWLFAASPAESQQRSAAPSPSRLLRHTAHRLRSIVHPEAYCRKILSIQGQNGSAALVRVICILRDAGRTPEEAWAFLQQWNKANAIPPWSEQELRYALRRHHGLS